MLENGFESEEHEVMTEDGYKLTMHRIYSKEDAPPEGQKRKAVLLQHGFLDSSAIWIINKPKGAPAFKLAKAGYDVWLGNNRGTTYSRDHKYLDAKKDRDYWNFTISEFGKYDQPAQVDYIRNHTGQDKITYIGHS